MTPTDTEQVQSALDHAIAQISFWTERAATLSEALLQATTP